MMISCVTRFTVDPFDRPSLHPTGGDKSVGWISINTSRIWYVGVLLKFVVSLNIWR